MHQNHIAHRRVWALSIQQKFRFEIYLLDSDLSDGYSAIQRLNIRGLGDLLLLWFSW